MKRGAKLLLVICAMVVLLVAIVIGIVATFDWNRAKPWLSETVAKAALSKGFGEYLAMETSPDLVKESLRRLDTMV